MQKKYYLTHENQDDRREVIRENYRDMIIRGRLYDNLFVKEHPMVKLVTM